MSSADDMSSCDLIQTGQFLVITISIGWTCKDVFTYLIKATSLFGDSTQCCENIMKIVKQQPLYFSKYPDRSLQFMENRISYLFFNKNYPIIRKKQLTLIKFHFELGNFPKYHLVQRLISPNIVTFVVLLSTFSFKCVIFSNLGTCLICCNDSVIKDFLNIWGVDHELKFRFQG